MWDDGLKPRYIDYSTGTGFHTAAVAAPYAFSIGAGSRPLRGGSELQNAIHYLVPGE